jgi:hypothetical protein
MYFMYVDESGDPGVYDTAQPSICGRAVTTFSVVLLFPVMTGETTYGLSKSPPLSEK